MINKYQLGGITRIISRSSKPIYEQLFKTVKKDIAYKPVSQHILESLRKNPKAIKETGPIAKLLVDVKTPKTKGVGYFIPHTSKLSVREQLGLSKGAYGSLNKYQKQALEDYAYYQMSGKNRHKFIFDPRSGKFRYGTVVQTSRGEVPAIEYISQQPGAKVNDYYVRSADGTMNYNFQSGQSGIALTPQGYALGELRAFPEENGIQKSIILTSPRVDYKDSAIEIIPEKLSAFPNRIPKEDMKIFWDYVQQTTKPGTYLSGDAGAMPLGGHMIKSKSPAEAIKILLKDSADSGIIQRDGLSPDSYKAIVKQGLRPEHRLRFSRNGFTKLNSSAVDNKILYDQWKAANTPELKQQFIKNWNDQIYPNSAFINQRGQIEFLQPFAYYMNKGGKLINDRNT